MTAYRTDHPQPRDGRPGVGSLILLACAIGYILAHIALSIAP